MTTTITPLPKRKKSTAPFLTVRTKPEHYNQEDLMVILQELSKSCKDSCDKNQKLLKEELEPFSVGLRDQFEERILLLEKISKMRSILAQAEKYTKSLIEQVVEQLTVLETANRDGFLKSLPPNDHLMLSEVVRQTSFHVTSMPSSAIQVPFFDEATDCWEEAGKKIKYLEDSTKYEEATMIGMIHFDFAVEDNLIIQYRELKRRDVRCRMQSSFLQGKIDIFKWLAEELHRENKLRNEEFFAISDSIRALKNMNHIIRAYQRRLLWFIEKINRAGLFQEAPTELREAIDLCLRHR